MLNACENIVEYFYTNNQLHIANRLSLDISCGGKRRKLCISCPTAIKMCFLFTVCSRGAILTAPREHTVNKSRAFKISNKKEYKERHTTVYVFDHNI